MRVLGIDPGSRVTGWALVDFTAKPCLVDAGALRPKGEALSGRLLELRKGLSDLVDKHRPDVAAVERVFAGVNAQSLITLGEARGVLLVTLLERGVEVAEPTPAEIKKSVTGTGAAEKEQVRRMVTALLGRPLHGRLGLDAADAAAAALTHGFMASRRGAVVVARAAEGEARIVRRRPAG